MRKLLLTVLLPAAALSAGAAHLTPQEALEAALASGPQKIKGITTADYRLSYTTDNAGVYAFNRGTDGFIIVSADSDALYPVMGYSDEGSIDPDNMPPAMEWWLDMLSKSVYTAPEKASRADIAPLLKTEWGQGSPYNLDCPRLNGSRTPTGCMATAMAQIMKYWEYPAKGTGSITYRWTYGGEDITYNFAGTTFDWANMLDRYYGESTNATQRAAVAELMYAVGCATQMQYSSQASGTTDLVAGSGLVTYLGYDKALTVAVRDTYGFEEWKQLVYSELQKGHPILYTGSGQLGGHAFVCDGYRNDGGADMFHINWGWDSMSDGYFLLNNLSPEELGTGGGGGNFNYAQSAFLGIKPAESGSSYVPYFVVLGKTGTERPSYNHSNTEILVGATSKSETYGVGGFFNFGLTQMYVTFGVKLSADGREPIYIASASRGNLKPSAGTNAMQLNGNDFPTEGTWTVTPVINYENKWYEMRSEATNVTVITAQCTADKINFTVKDTPLGLSLTVPEIESKVIFKGREAKISVEASCFGEDYSGTLTPVLYKSRAVRATGETLQVNLGEGEATTLSWNTKFTPSESSAIEPASYTLYLMDADGELVSKSVSVVFADPDAQTVLDITDTTINKVDASTDKATAVSSGDITFKGRITCTGGYLDGPVTATVVDADNNEVATLGNPIDMLLGVSSSKSMTFSGKVEGLEKDKAYSIVVATEQAVIATYPFYVGEAGIENISVEEADADATFFTLQGIRVSVPQSGNIYIMQRDGHHPAKVLVK